MSKLKYLMQQFQLKNCNFTQVRWFFKIQMKPFLVSDQFQWNRSETKIKCTVSVKLGTKKRAFLAKNWLKEQFHETVIWLKCWNCQFGRKKLKLLGRGAAACRQFQFFSGRIWQFQHFMPISRFHETCPKISTLTLKLLQKLSFLFVSFQVKLCDNKIKKWTRFGMKLCF